jgi:hypothetical protein
MKLKKFRFKRINDTLWQVYCENIRVCIIKQGYTTEVNGIPTLFWSVKYTLSNMKSEHYASLSLAELGICESIKKFISEFIEGDVE